MTKNNTKNFKNTLKTLKEQRRNFILNKEKKEQNKNDLIAFMKDNPVRNNASHRHEPRSLFPAGMAQRSLIQLNFSHKPMAIILTIAIVATMGGGVSFAAQDSLPGDVLYPVKINVNERVEGAFAFSEEAKMELALEHTERRFQETGRLASEGRLSEKASAQIESRLSMHIEQASRLSEKFEERNDSAKTAEINARLEALLNTSSEILANVEKDTAENLGRQIARINAIARNESTTTAQAGARAEASIRAEANAEGRKQVAESLMKAAEKNLEHAVSLSERSRVRVSADAQHHIDASVNLIAEGKTQIEAKNYSEAFVSFQNALRHSQRARALIASSVNIETGTRGQIELDRRNERGDQNERQGTTTEENNNNTETEIEVETESELESSILPEASLEGRANANIRGGF